MNFLYIFIHIPLVLSLPPSDYPYNFTEDIVRIAEQYSCKKSCWFDKAEITMETIDLWPKKCSEVCGIITLNQNSDVPEEKLTTAFANLKSLKGALRIYNTQLKNVNFLRNLTHVSCDFLVMQISDNFLNDVQFLFDMQYSSDDCIFNIHHNLNANFSGMCQNSNYERFTEFLLHTNKASCGCQSEDYGVTFENCKATYGTLSITNATEQEKRLATLREIRNITGNLTVAYTSLQNLSVLSNLERITFRSYGYNVINIHNNLRMKRLGWTSLKALIGIDGPLTMNLENVHRDFCLTKDEFQLFTSAKTNFTGIQPTYCGSKDSYYENKTWCSTNTMKDLVEGCTIVFNSNGLKIATGDEEYVHKLEDVTSCESRLIIEKTSLTDLSFLDGLENFNYLDDFYPCINISSNKFLRLGASFPNLKNSAFIDSRAIVITNTPLAFDNATDCWETQVRLNMPIVWDGKDCDGEPYNMTSYESSGTMRITLTCCLLVICHVFL